MHILIFFSAFSYSGTYPNDYIVCLKSYQKMVIFSARNYGSFMEPQVRFVIGYFGLFFKSVIPAGRLNHLVDYQHIGLFHLLVFRGNYVRKLGLITSTDQLKGANLRMKFPHMSNHSNKRRLNIKLNWVMVHTS